MKKFILSIIAVSFCTLSFAQIVEVPDTLKPSSDTLKVFSDTIASLDVKDTVVAVIDFQEPIVDDASVPAMPFSKYLNYSMDEFAAEEFRYNENTNQYIFSHMGAGTALTILSALGGSNEVSTSKSDYKIVVSMTADKIPAQVSIVFYDPEIVDTFWECVEGIEFVEHPIKKTGATVTERWTGTIGDFVIDLTQSHTTQGHTNVSSSSSYGRYTSRSYATASHVDTSYQTYVLNYSNGLAVFNPKAERKAMKASANPSSRQSKMF